MLDDLWEFKTVASTASNLTRQCYWRRKIACLTSSTIGLYIWQNDSTRFESFFGYEFGVKIFGALERTSHEPFVFAINYCSRNFIKCVWQICHIVLNFRFASHRVKCGIKADLFLKQCGEPVKLFRSSSPCSLPLTLRVSNPFDKPCQTTLYGVSSRVKSKLDAVETLAYQLQMCGKNGPKIPNAK